MRPNGGFSAGENAGCEARAKPEDPRMLLAPFSLADVSPSTRARRSAQRPAAAPPGRVPPWLVSWAVLGTLGVLFVPGLRGGGLLGATLPFWLCAAPLLDMAWLTRHRWLAALRRRARVRAA